LVKICDFGSACYLPPGEFMDDGLGRGTTPYMAPEILMQRQYTHLIDVYSLGVVFWVMLTGRMPFDNIPSSVGMLVAIKGGDWFEFPMNFLDGSPCPFGLTNLVEKCLEVDPARRIIASDLLEGLELLKEGAKGD